MPRFVLLHHCLPPELAKPSHWDLMLEQTNALATWQLHQLPVDWQRTLGQENNAKENSVLAVLLPDHRLKYLDYEGPISDNRGEVHRTDGGTYEILQQSDDSLRICLNGEKLQGIVEIYRTAGEPYSWRLNLS